MEGLQLRKDGIEGEGCAGALQQLANVLQAWRLQQVVAACVMSTYR
jgi:hypothetical protein